MHLKAFSAHQWLIRKLQIKCFALESCWMNRNTVRFGFFWKNLCQVYFMLMKLRSMLCALCLTVCVSARECHQMCTTVFFPFRNQLQESLDIGTCIGKYMNISVHSSAAWFICLFSSSDLKHFQLFVILLWLYPSYMTLYTILTSIRRHMNFSELSFSITMSKNGNIDYMPLYFDKRCLQ